MAIAGRLAQLDRAELEAMTSRSKKPKSRDGFGPKGPLAIELAAYAAEVRERRPKAAAAIDRLVERMTAAGAGQSAPAIGEPLPPFCLPDETGHLLALEDLLGKGPLVVMLRRGHWCPYCRLATKAVVGIEPEARKLGAGFVAITPERRPFSNAFQSATGAEFPVLSDPDDGYALSLGLAMWLGEELIAVLREFDFDLVPFQGSSAWTLPIPATFVLDGRGIIVARHVDPDYRRRIEAADVLAAVRRAAQAAP
ncbi:MAG: AhpC/TSA family protein [Hyphomicrobiaceae bacterium]|nr:MAG: AhpC/TSA family protein [Hyphomicrobiaceae bacterium]